MIDSSTLTSFEDFEALQIGRQCRLVIFDSTCFSLQGGLFKRAMKKLESLNCPVVLLRSSIKLDCLATEFGRFGHVIFLAKDKSPALEKLNLEYERLRPHFGTTVGSRQIFPFYQNRQFQKFSESWCQRIRSANKIAAKTLAERFGGEFAQWTGFEHSLFLWFQIPGDFERAEKNEKAICKALLFQEVPYLATSSFPWPAVTLTSFYRRDSYTREQKLSPMDRRMIRIGFGDFDPSTAEVYAQKLADILLRYRL